MTLHEDQGPPSSLRRRADRLSAEHTRTDAGHPVAVPFSSSSHRRPPPPPPPRGSHQGSSSHTAPAPSHQLTSATSFGHSLSSTSRRTPPPIPIRKTSKSQHMTPPPQSHSPTRPRSPPPPPKRRPPPAPPSPPPHRSGIGLYKGHDPPTFKPSLFQDKKEQNGKGPSDEERRYYRFYPSQEYAEIKAVPRPKYNTDKWRRYD